MMRSGIAYPLAPLALATEGTESGSLPTLTAQGFSNEGQIKKLAENYEIPEALAMCGRRKKTLRRFYPTPGAGDAIKMRLNPAMMKRVDARLEGSKPSSPAGHQYQESLPERVELMEKRMMWPTVRVSSANGPALSEIRANDPKCRLECSVIVRSSDLMSLYDSAKSTVPKSGHPQLSPEFCEWLMGYPRGYTESGLWGTQSFRSWPSG
jgi:hypothetical protein